MVSADLFGLHVMRDRAFSIAACGPQGDQAALKIESIDAGPQRSFEQLPAIECAGAHSLGQFHQQVQPLF
jgi:hypothetical protein